MKKMKKRVAVSCYEFQIVGLERSKRGLRGRPTPVPANKTTAVPEFDKKVDPARDVSNFNHHWPIGLGAEK